MTVIHSYREVQFSAVILLKLICPLCMCLHILANHPGKLTLCPAILETFKIVLEAHSIKYKSDRDRMLVGLGSFPATGWMPVC